jgi:hypothetical protein
MKTGVGILKYYAFLTKRLQLISRHEGMPDYDSILAAASDSASTVSTINQVVANHDAI